jgi:uncharacterized membrane protein YraQ (UPF0718 family)
METCLLLINSFQKFLFDTARSFNFGQGPVLVLLLAGPSLSLPNMLVLRSVIGIKKTLVYIGLVIIMATLSVLDIGIIRT